MSALRSHAPAKGHVTSTTTHRVVRCCRTRLPRLALGLVVLGAMAMVSGRPSPAQESPGTPPQGVIGRLVEALRPLPVEGDARRVVGVLVESESLAWAYVERLGDQTVRELLRLERFQAVVRVRRQGGESDTALARRLGGEGLDRLLALRAEGDGAFLRLRAEYLDIDHDLADLRREGFRRTPLGQWTWEERLNTCDLCLARRTDAEAVYDTRIWADLKLSPHDPWPVEAAAIIDEAGVARVGLLDERRFRIFRVEGKGLRLEVEWLATVAPAALRSRWPVGRVVVVADPSDGVLWWGVWHSAWAEGALLRQVGTQLAPPRTVSGVPLMVRLRGGDLEWVLGQPAPGRYDLSSEIILFDAVRGVRATRKLPVEGIQRMGSTPTGLWVLTTSGDLLPFTANFQPGSPAARGLPTVSLLAQAGPDDPVMFTSQPRVMSGEDRIMVRGPSDLAPRHESAAMPGVVVSMSILLDAGAPGGRDTVFSMALHRRERRVTFHRTVGY